MLYPKTQYIWQGQSPQQHLNHLARMLDAGLQTADIQALYQSGIYGVVLSGLLSNSANPQQVFNELSSF